MEPYSCRACGLSLRPGARFCDGCGARAPSGSDAEYKQVTIMFADVVRSMAIARTVGPERLGEIMAELVGRATEIVQRHGGVVSQFTGDGLMAVFGAPIAMEHHALCACRAALAVCAQTRQVAEEVRARDGIELQLRVGLNSGQVIAGEIGVGTLGYTTIGEHVGLAQRMESVAPPDGVMLSGSTARLVERSATLGPPESVAIKGQSVPFPVRRLLAVPDDPVPPPGHGEPLVGRSEVVDTIGALLDRTVGGRGGVTRIVGPAGIGKTRMAREACRIAAAREMAVYGTYCEAHTRHVSAGAVARLLRTVLAVADDPPARARARVRAACPGADTGDLLLLDDLLGIGDASTPLPDITPEARLRRMTALVQRCLLACEAPTVYLVEDAHWIDTASESMFGELADALGHAHALLLITHRPEYSGILAEIPGTASLMLQPLRGSETSALVTAMLGTDPTVGALTDQIVEKSSGNPFFAHEIVRDLAERGVLEGSRGHYRCTHPLDEIPVPPTLQATIAARIDRLGAVAKSVLYAGAVVGMHVDASVVGALLDNVPTSAAVAELCQAELVEPAPTVASTGFVFCHPVVRAVAYESQLRSTRNRLHRRAAGALAQTDAVTADQHAAMIAEHLHAAGDLRAACEWHMRAGNWLQRRDRAAAWASWQRARAAATGLPESDPDRARILTTVLTRLCTEVSKTGGNLSDAGFDDLRALCTASGDDRSLAIGTAGMIMGLTGQHRHREALALTVDLQSLIESVGDPALTCGLLPAITYAMSEVGRLREALRLAEKVIGLAADDVAKGNVLFGSPLVSAIRMRGLYRLCLGIDGWRTDGDAAIALSRHLDPTSRVSSVLYKYILAVPVGALKVDRVARRQTAEALSVAEQAGDRHTLALARIARGLVLVHGRDPGEEGTVLLRQARESVTTGGFTLNAVALVDPALALVSARAGELGHAIDLSRGAIAQMSHSGEVLSMGVATTVLVESLLARGAEGDRAEAIAAVQRLAAIPTDDGFVLNELPVLRLRALIARSDGDMSAFHRLRESHQRRCAAAGFDLPAY
ncbi:ATP-binding protein [Mycobacterium sp. 4D054]|uniref:ATP-binding protein n=1 Tax=Mycobacterium sp. 4D054 TaxID=3457440 RepID=UPI003FD3C6BE